MHGNWILLVVFGGILLTSLGVSFHFVRRKQKITPLSQLETDSGYRCPQCHREMTRGFTMAGRGIHWRNEDSDPINMFSSIYSSLDNTFSVGIPPEENLSWHCPQCQLLLIDHSTLYKIHH